ncbi:MAG TPA: amino acid deaminase/aldolase [Nocardioidaceae bacterium]|nr:amino acid deaminase/aldolase [Nocardioidaceae bacterium]
MNEATLAGQVARHRLRGRLDAAVRALDEPPSSPVVVVDLDAFDANAADLVRRASDTPVRVASKSVRVPSLLSRVLTVPGFAGVLAYSLREALWLHRHGICGDVVMGYPSVNLQALRDLTHDDSARAAVTLMVDDVDQLDLVCAAGVPDGPPVRVALDVDAGLRLGLAHVGPRRSPLRDAERVLALANEVQARRGLALVGVMTYEGQVAGVPDDVPGQAARSAAVRAVKRASVARLREHRRTVAEALRDVAELEFWNAGGSGSLETSSADPVVTEVTAGSGLLVPALFDHYRSFTPRPAQFFGVPVVRRPSAHCVTVAGGGLVASGPAGADRLPLPWAPPGLRLTGLEGAGEVQTPLRGPAAQTLAVGDLVWFRHGKSGELAEHTNEVLLLRGDRIVDRVPTYRGTGNAW